MFANGNALARVADYRGRGTFEGFDEPVASLPRPEAAFRVRDLVVSPAWSALASLDLGLDL